MKTTTMRRAELRNQNSEARRTITPLVRHIVTPEKPPQGKAGMIRWIEPDIGDVVTVHSVPGAYPLPAGLPEGAQLRLVRCEDSIRIVERDGWEFRVQMMNIEGKYEWV